jgi:hypothetical protein
MKQIQNRQKPVVQPRDRKPAEVIDLRKMNRALKRKWPTKVRKSQK